MVHHIEPNQVSKEDDGNYSAEASTLRFPPGQWPIHLRLLKVGENSELFTFKERKTDGEGDMLYVVYQSADKKTMLKVFND